MSSSSKIELNIDISKSYKRLANANKRRLLYVGILAIILVVANMFVGSYDFGPAQLFEVLTGNATKQLQLVFVNLRLPHVLCSIVCGAGLGICGCMLQSSLGNVLASPSTIGISQGASCGACIAIIAFGSTLGASFIGVAGTAFVIALVPCAIVIILSKAGMLSKTGIILAGVAMSIFFSGIVALVEYFADSSKVAEVLFWTFGSVHNAKYPEIIIMGVVIIFCFIFALINFINYNAMECGDTTAHSIGLNTTRTRIIHIAIAALGTACITAFCGTINFIGLIAPHIMRKWVSSNYKFLIPASALCGICLVTLSDIISCVLLPGVILPIGAITSFIGAPIFIYALISKGAQY